MPESFGGFEPPDDPTPPLPGMVNLGFKELKEFPTGARQLWVCRAKKKWWKEEFIGKTHVVPLPPPSLYSARVDLPLPRDLPPRRCIETD